jgi:hypothetical protein
MTKSRLAKWFPDAPFEPVRTHREWRQNPSGISSGFSEGSMASGMSSSQDTVSSWDENHLIL